MPSMHAHAIQSIVNKEMNTQYNCKLYIPNQSNDYTHGCYTTSISVQNKILEHSRLSSDLLGEMESDIPEFNNNQFEDGYLAFETDRQKMQNNNITENDSDSTPYCMGCCTHANKQPHKQPSLVYTTEKNQNDKTNYNENYNNADKEAEDKLNNLIAEHIGEGNDNWPLVQIPLDIKYEVFRRRRRGDAVNEWSNAYDTTKDPLQCTGPDSERNEPVCC